MTIAQIVSLNAFICEGGFGTLKAEVEKVEGGFHLKFPEWSDFIPIEERLDELNGWVAFRGKKYRFSVECTEDRPDPRIPMDRETAKDRFGSIFAALNKIPEA